MGQYEKFEKVRRQLNDVGAGFCLAKWMQVTLHLHIGHNHSCHHPQTHKISTTEIDRDPSALHNTRYKKERRREMLEGKKPSECDYCWGVEDNSNQFSDRHFKSAEPWAYPQLDKIKDMHWRDNINPSYVEVSFSNACNFKCSYCAPPFSSKWMEEIEQHGAYPTSDKFNGLDHFKHSGRIPIPQNEHNPYVEAFWEWWPELYQDLHTFRITGGEPMMHKDTMKVLDYIIDSPSPNRNLCLSINSNLGVPESLYQKFREKFKIISDRELVKELIIFTSCDGYGEQAEYIRNGMVYNQLMDRIDDLLYYIPRLTIDIMSTYNILSVPSYKKLINDVYDLKAKHTNAIRYYKQPLLLDASYLRYPNHQSITLLDQKEWESEFFEQAQLMDFYDLTRTDQNTFGYSDVEVVKIRRIYDYFMGDVDEFAREHHRKDFYKFFSEHDKRRGTDFCKTYPELADFYHKCKEIR
jgi:hypothetical protein